MAEATRLVRDDAYEEIGSAYQCLQVSALDAAMQAQEQWKTQAALAAQELATAKAHMTDWEATKAKKTTAVKASSKAEDFRAKSGDELNAQLSNLKKEQFNLRFQRANGQVENTGRIRVLRRDIARIQTVLTEQRRAAPAKG